ncbi:MAG: retroviral-like aspartic protease family protein [Spirochaetales bacterium]|jgi:clan AA aspartic protease|nr:retroviral-like aspartic protease family protein [Spirochaetales bacterium]
MSIVYTDITLKNAWDVANAGRGLVEEKDIRSVAVHALVDTGAVTLVINEAVREALGLEIRGSFNAALADGSKQAYAATEPVDIQWKDRESSCRAIFVPDADEVLLGAIPMEDMDLIVHPRKQEVVGAHGNEVVYIIK